MSTQNSSFPSIPFSISTSQQSFRLLELPSELVDLITSDTRPDSILLKSSLAPQPTQQPNPQSATEGFLHLCTDDRSWAVRQVSTSNSVFVTEPTTRTLPEHGNSIEQQDGFFTSGSSITAVAKVNNLLELVEVRSDLEEVERFLDAIVSVYVDEEEDGSAGGQEGMLQGRQAALQDIFDNIPAPNNLIRAGMRNAMMFEDPVSGQYRRPSAGLLLRAWTAVVRTAAVLAVDLGESFGYRSLLAAVQSDEEGGYLLASVAEAVLRAFLIDLEGQALSDEEYGVKESARLSPQTWVFVGRTLVKGTGMRGMDLEKAIGEWKSLVPDSWVDSCMLEALGDGFVTISGADGKQMVRYGLRDSLSDEQGDLSNGGMVAAPSTASKTQGKRKWHEKFAAQREAAKKR